MEPLGVLKRDMGVARIEEPLEVVVVGGADRTRDAVFTGEIQPEAARDFANDLANRYLKN